MGIKAGLLTIGDELISGFTVDTNAVWLSKELHRRGVSVTMKASVGDETGAIEAILNQWDGKYDWVITTGGLGPTHDDITKLAFCNYFDSETRFDEGYWHELVERFKARGYDIPDNNRSQAEIPTKAEFIANPVGTAPGLKFVSQGTTFIVLPGVPREMKAIMTDHVLPGLEGHAPIAWLTLHTIGIFESALAEMLEPVMTGLTGVHLAYLPSYSGVDLRLRGLETGGAGRVRVDEAAAKLEALLGEQVYGRDSDSLASVVGQLLLKGKETVALAESCSGGLTASHMTDVPGSSAYFLGGVVAYSNGAKVSQLGVNPATLETHGAVSEQTARELAEGVKTAFDATWGVATTGIAGPSGGSDEKPVGLVYLAVAGPDGTHVKKARLVPERLPHKSATAQAALNLLRLELLRHGR